jgi:hypothetical protein
MASRKEQNEQLRREREEREAAARAAERRRRTIGVAAAAALVIAVVAVLAVVLVGGDDGGGGGGGGEAGNVLPDGGEVPEQKVTDLKEAAAAANCELRNFKAKSRDHTQDEAERIEYESSPPTSGRHFEVAAEDGAYEAAPDVKQLVHSLEHGRVIVWFKKNLPREQRANLNAFYEEDTFQMLITPDETGSPYAVSATAWNAEPTPLGTGRLLGCRRFTPAAFDALRAFKDEHRSNGPEPVP